MPVWYGFGRNRSFHFVAQKSAYSGRSNSASINFSRFFSSLLLRNARVSSGVGSRPMMSRNARR